MEDSARRTNRPMNCSKDCLGSTTVRLVGVEVANTLGKTEATKMQSVVCVYPMVPQLNGPNVYNGYSLSTRITRVCSFFAKLNIDNIFF
jgi:hypothetical protein